MKVELTQNEAMWILDKVAKECARGEEAIDRLKDSKEPSIMRALKMAREIVETLAKLGIKIANAAEEEIKSNLSGGKAAN